MGIHWHYYDPLYFGEFPWRRDGEVLGLSMGKSEHNGKTLFFRFRFDPHFRFDRKWYFHPRLTLKEIDFRFRVDPRQLPRSWVNPLMRQNHNLHHEQNCKKNRVNLIFYTWNIYMYTYFRNNSNAIWNFYSNFWRISLEQTELFINFWRIPKPSDFSGTSS